MERQLDDLIKMLVDVNYTPPRSKKSMMSLFRQAVILGPNLTGFGNRPDFTLAQTLDFENETGPRGAMMSLRRTKPPLLISKLFCMSWFHFCCETSVYIKDCGAVTKKPWSQ